MLYTWRALICVWPRVTRKQPRHKMLELIFSKLVYICVCETDLHEYTGLWNYVNQWTHGTHCCLLIGLHCVGPGVRWQELAQNKFSSLQYVERFNPVFLRISFVLLVSLQTWKYVNQKPPFWESKDCGTIERRCVYFSQLFIYIRQGYKILSYIPSPLLQ